MEQVSFNFMAAVTICSGFGAPKIKSLTVSVVSPSVYCEVMGPDAMTLVLWMLIFKLTFPLFSFNFIRGLFSSSSLSAIRVVPFAYLRLLIFLLTLLIPACGSSGLEFCLMYSAYKLSKQVTVYRLDVLLSWFGTSFSSMSDSNCGFLTCTQISWEACQVLPSI